LITTLAVMSGFQREIRDRMLQMAAHTTVSGYGEPLQEWQRAVDDRVAGSARVAGAAPYIEKEALISGSNNQPAMLRGVVPARGNHGLRDRREAGARQAGRSRAGQLQDRAGAWNSRSGWALG
jgi:ABC-type lipoprotein release transport system permease subunit